MNENYSCGGKCQRISGGKRTYQQEEKISPICKYGHYLLRFSQLTKEHDSLKAISMSATHGTYQTDLQGQMLLEVKQGLHMPITAKTLLTHFSLILAFASNNLTPMSAGS